MIELRTPTLRIAWRDEDTGAGNELAAPLGNLGGRYLKMNFRMRATMFSLPALARCLGTTNKGLRRWMRDAGRRKRAKSDRQFFPKRRGR